MNGTAIEELPLQVRHTFVEVRDSPLGLVQVADELGFAYLDQDIDFGATGRNEIYQNIKFIILTEYFSVPLDREFGMDYSMVDKPIPIAEAVLSQEIAMKISLYEPRAQFKEISFVRDFLAGKLSPSVVIVLLSNEELPSSMAPVSPAAIGGPPGTVIEEVDLPGFFESLIEMARVPGPPGPIGPVGTAATIEVGNTTTGLPGTQAIIINVGDTNAAIFDFTIPKGDKGDQGTGVNIKGTVPNSSSLPTTGNQTGDMWIVADTGHGWTWNGTAWVDAGPIQGPVGPQGPQGATGSQGAQGIQGVKGDTGATGSQGPQGIQGNIGVQGPVGPSNVLTVSGTTTGAAGSNANVSVSGTSPSQSLAFTIPRGDVGSQGIQGPTGIAATVTAGTTVTGAPGSNANVVNAGTTSAAVFNFTVPRGDIGAQGPQGAQGIQGIQGVPGDITGPATSVNGEFIAFNGTTGKIIKRPTQASGFAKHVLNGAFTTQTQMDAGDLAPGAIHNQTQKTTDLVNADEFVVWDSTVSALRRIAASKTHYLPRNHLTGLKVANNATDVPNDIDIAVGECRSDDNTDDIYLTTPLTKRLDAVWAAGTNQGCRDTGAIADVTWHYYLIKNPTTGAVDVVATVTYGSPTMPSGFTLKRRILSIRLLICICVDPFLACCPAQSRKADSICAPVKS